MPSKPALHRSNDRARLMDARRERSGSFGLSRSLPGLTHGSVTRPSRTFEGFRPRQPTRSHRCDRAVNLWIRSPSKRSPEARVGVSCAACCHDSHKADFLSWGRTPSGASPRRGCPPPLRRPPLRAPLLRSPVASTPGPAFARRPSAPSCHARDLVPPSWFRTTSTAFSATGSQVCCTLLPTMGFATFPAADTHDRGRTRRRRSPRRHHPSKNVSAPPWAPPSPGALAPLPFFLLRGRRLRGCFRWTSAVASSPVADRRRPVLPGLLIPLQGLRVAVGAPTRPVTGPGERSTRRR
jgi:hypothetical protein